MSQPIVRLNSLPTLKLLVKVESGPDFGSTYQLIPPRITMGRGPENDIVISDPKASRVQAEILILANEIQINDLSSRQSLSINGVQTKSATLKANDKISFGSTVLRIYFEVPEATRNSVSAFKPPTQKQKSKSALADKVRFYVVVVVLFGGLGWMIYSGSQSPKKSMTPRSLAEQESAIQNLEKSADEVESRTRRSEEEQARFEEANRHFHQGFRDYNDSEFVNAIRAFETAKSIDPTHALAQRYSLLAQRKRDEQIAELVRQAHSYREKRMYRMCSGIVTKAITLMPNRQDLKYQESITLRRECDALDKEASPW